MAAHSRDSELNQSSGLTSYQRSRVDHLARTRRNQQRCRERKRAHVSELESQVEALQDKIRQCEPCGPTVAVEAESKLDKAVRENAARRDLLLALGFDDGAQERFIESESKRQAVLSILNSSGGQESASQTPGSWTNGEPAQTPSTAAFGAATSNSVQPMHPLDLDANQQALDFGQQLETFDPDNWLLYPDTQAQLQPYMSGLPNDDSWLSQPFSNSAIAPIASPSSTSTEAPPAPTTSNGQQPKNDQCCERCFQDTVVEVSPSENLMACSTALSMIFRHNRKGLALAELQQRLRPGMRPPSEDSKECRIEEGVLFKVLADISG